MSKTKDEVIANLVAIVLEQDETIEELRQVITRIRQYIDICEKHIREGRDHCDDNDTSGDV